MSSKAGPFEELKRALAQVEAEDVVENETEEDRQWTDVLRAATAGETGLGVLTNEAMEEIAATAIGLSFDLDRQKRTREFIRREMRAGRTRTTQGVPAPAAIYRREGPSDSADRAKAQETIERLRRRLDEEDGPSR